MVGVRWCWAMSGILYAQYDGNGELCVAHFGSGGAAYCIQNVSEIQVDSGSGADFGAAHNILYLLKAHRIALQKVYCASKTHFGQNFDAVSGVLYS